MDLSSFNEHIERFSAIVLPRLSSSLPFSVTNTYVKHCHGSKYLYFSFHLGNSRDVHGLPGDPENGHYFEFTVSYDRFYCVPVLYFRRDHKVTGYDSPYAAIDTHPLLHTPYMVVHACETENTMGPTGLHGLDYLSLWFTLQMTLVLPEVELRG